MSARSAFRRPPGPVPFSRGPAWGLEPVNAQELVDALAGARRVSVQANGIQSSTLVSGIEITQAASGAIVTSAARGRGGRRAGRRRSCFIADDPEAECLLRALGPVSSDGPLRSLAPDALLDALRRLPALSHLQAVRQLAEQLEHLDRTGVAGLTVKGPGTEYLYRTKLRGVAEWRHSPEALAARPARRGGWRARPPSLRSPAPAQSRPRAGSSNGTD